MQVERLFRAVNEQLARIVRRFRPLADDIEIICECSRQSCVEQVLVPTGEYERVRRNPRLFIVKPAHDLAGVEEVVEEHYAYCVVRKDVTDGSS